MDEASLEQLKNFSILCVEDEEGIRKRLINTLKYYFDDIYEANSGNSGYEQYLKHKPDLIISDIQMTNGDGVSFIKKVRGNDLYTKVIMLTAYTNEEFLLDLINLQINHYIIKPLNADKLLEGIMSALGDKITPILDFSDGLYLDAAKRELIFENQSITLRKRENEFLKLLHKNKQCCMTTYEQIEAEIWDGKHMSATALKTFIKELRKKIPKDIIVNVPQEGYKLL